MSEIPEIAKKVAEKIVEKVSDIDLILLYGSIAQGRGHERSDYDMIAISDKVKVVWEFVIDEVPISLWHHTWKSAEEALTGKRCCWSVGATSLMDAKIVYSRNKKVLERFEELKDKVNIGSEYSLKEAIRDFDQLYGGLWRIQKCIQKENYLDIRFLKYNLVNWLIHILSCLNKKYLKNNWGKQFPEISEFEKLPNEFIVNTKELLLAEPKETLELAEKLVEDVRLLLKENIKEKEINEDEKFIASEWPGIIEYLNKIKSAAEKDDFYAGHYAATDNAEYYLWAFLLLQKERWNRSAFYSAKDSLPKLSKNIPKHISTLLTSKNLIELMQSTEQLSKILKEELLLRGADLPETETIDNAIQFIQVKELEKN